MIARIGGAVLAALLFIVSSYTAAADAAPQTGVLVVGGTPAGVAAAVAAARAGRRVVLAVAGTQLGGVLTDAAMDQWDLNLAPDGRSVAGGLFPELYAKLGDVFTPADAARAFAQLVAAEPNIRTMYGAEPVAADVAVVNGVRTIGSVTFARAGKPDLTIGAAAVVDASDAADLAALAGARYDVGRQDTGIDERTQAVTLMFTLDGVDWTKLARCYDVIADGAGGVIGPRAWGYAKLMAGYHPLSPDVLVRDLNLGREDDGGVTVNAIDVLGVDGRFASQLARARALTEAEVPHLLDFLRARLPGFANARVATYASAVYVRETRHVLGDAWLTAHDVWHGVVPADCVALASYPIDLHPVDATDRAAYAPIRHVYGIPLAALIPRTFANLLVAGPSISASHEAAGSARTIPTTIEEGEAAGTAAALAIAQHTGVADLETPAGVALLQNELRRHGAILRYG